MVSITLFFLSVGRIKIYNITARSFINIAMRRENSSLKEQITAQVKINHKTLLGHDDKGQLIKTHLF